MLEEDKKILKYNHGEKTMKHPFIFYADLENFYLKKWIFVVIILKNHQQLKNVNIKLLVI